MNSQPCPPFPYTFPEGVGHRAGNLARSLPSYDSDVRIIDNSTMYAIAYYRRQSDGLPVFVGSTCCLVINGLKTLKGIIKRARKAENIYGRAALYGIELWHSHDSIYGPAWKTYTFPNGYPEQSRTSLGVLVYGTDTVKPVIV